KQGRASVPCVYHVHKDGMVRVNQRPGGKDHEVIHGCTWGGQADVIQSLLLSPPVQAGVPGGFPVIWETFSPQDAVDFALFAVKTTIDTMRFQARLKNVGGPVDVLLLTPRDSAFIQKKQLHA